MKKQVTVDVAVLGAGPAGLTAARRCAEAGCTTLIIDRNLHSGGQLVKQIHRFFGTRDHGAGTRGTDVASQLSQQALDAGAVLWSDSSCHTITPSCRLEVLTGGLELAGDPGRMQNRTVKARRVIIATGAEENAVAFAGWTLPGVMGAGAAQTLMNVHRVLPGRRVLMVGSGNVGLIVAHQLLQAGAEVAAVLEADARVGGYAVHAAKLRRTGVSILTSHTIGSAHGNHEVERATVVRLDENYNALTGTERELGVDTVCVAAGLRPTTRLAQLAGCELIFSETLGGWTPVHGTDMGTSNPRVYVAGDACGVEEASTAMEEGRLAAAAVVRDLGLMDAETAREEIGLVRTRLNGLRGGPFGSSRMKAKAEVHARAQRLQQGANNAQLAHRPMNNYPYDTREESVMQDDLVICRCEEVTVGQVRDAIARGAVTVTAVKRRTRAGMGLCQGRTCEVLVARILAETLSEPRSSLRPDRIRPPISPVTFGALAGEDRC